MTCELIGEFPAVNDREQMGRFLRHAFPLEAFPLELGSFTELLDDPHKRVKALSRH